MSMAEAMADRGHSTLNCRCIGILHGRNLGGRGGAHPSMEGEDLGENWFWLENLVEET